ncbi:MAG TPA: nuclear transport factor 2 family protein [Candidatus Limnocylindria bacterium]|nr:nuclear transport factor 2 family protein [Candidatus Limnocylindria bacterium]
MTAWFTRYAFGLTGLLFSFGIVAHSYEQNQKQTATTHVEVPTITSRVEDVSSLDGIIKAFYEVISGPVGEPRQWSRDRTLYIPGVRFVAMSEDAKGQPVAHVTDHQQFVDSTNTQLVQKGFFEWEIHRETKRFGNIAHIFSTYESRLTKDGPVIARGVNSIELYWDGKRWWIAGAIWDDERKDNPIPKDFLN